MHTIKGELTTVAKASFSGVLGTLDRPCTPRYPLPPLNPLPPDLPDEARAPHPHRIACIKDVEVKANNNKSENATLHVNFLKKFIATPPL